MKHYRFRLKACPLKLALTISFHCHWASRILSLGIDVGQSAHMSNIDTNVDSPISPLDITTKI